MHNDTHVYSKEYTPTQNFWANVFEEWPDKEKDIDPKDIPQPYNVLSVLTEREVGAIKMRCGLGCDPMTYRDIGVRFGVGKERVRQILMRAFRKLRHPERSGDKIRFLFATRNELKTQIADQKDQIQLLGRLVNEVTLRLSLVTKALPIEVVKNSPDLEHAIFCPEAINIEELDFSVRSYNCLKRSGKNTLADLMQLSREDVGRIRNLGYKGAIEVEEKLSQYGLSLVSDDAK